MPITTPVQLNTPSQGKAFLIQYNEQESVRLLLIFLTQENVPYPDQVIEGRTLFIYELDSEGKAGVIAYQNGIYSLFMRGENIMEVLQYLVEQGHLVTIRRTIIP